MLMNLSGNYHIYLKSLFFWFQTGNGVRQMRVILTSNHLGFESSWTSLLIQIQHGTQYVKLCYNLPWTDKLLKTK